MNNYDQIALVQADSFPLQSYIVWDPITERTVINGFQECLTEQGTPGGQIGSVIYPETRFLPALSVRPSHTVRALSPSGLIGGSFGPYREPTAFLYPIGGTLLDIHERLKEELPVIASEVTSISPSGVYAAGLFWDATGRPGLFRVGPGSKDLELKRLGKVICLRVVGVSDDGEVFGTLGRLIGGAVSALERIKWGVRANISTHHRAFRWKRPSWISLLPEAPAKKGSTALAISSGATYGTGTQEDEGGVPALTRWSIKDGLRQCRLRFTDAISQLSEKRERWTNIHVVGVNNSGAVLGLLSQEPNEVPSPLPWNLAANP